MEQKLNIAEILKTKRPIRLKLYSSTFGYIKFSGVYKDKIYFYSEDSNAHSVKSDGKMCDDGECIIFPSKEMRDWSKFAWKRGDVLVNNSGFKVLFDKWANDVYTGFYAKIDRLGDSAYYDTDRYTLSPEDEAASYIKIIEDKYEGKLNRETLEIDEHQEFKDGDILSCDEDTYTKYTILILHKDVDITESIVSLVRHSELVEDNEPIDDFFLTRLYPAREDEKKELFDALAKKGKAWDAEKKKVVDLKPKVELKPFDKVLVRNYDYNAWQISLFGYKNSLNCYYCCNGSSWIQCIPYEGNEHLLGTKF